MPKVRKEIPELEKLVQVGRNLSAIRKEHNYILWICNTFLKNTIWLNSTKMLIHIDDKQSKKKAELS